MEGFFEGLLGQQSGLQGIREILHATNCLSEKLLSSINNPKLSPFLRKSVLMKSLGTVRVLTARVLAVIRWHNRNNTNRKRLKSDPHETKIQRSLEVLDDIYKLVQILTQNNKDKLQNNSLFKPSFTLNSSNLILLLMLKNIPSRVTSVSTSQNTITVCARGFYRYTIRVHTNYNAGKDFVYFFPIIKLKSFSLECPTKQVISPNTIRRLSELIRASDNVFETLDASFFEIVQYGIMGSFTEYCKKYEQLLNFKIRKSSSSVEIVFLSKIEDPFIFYLSATQGGVVYSSYKKLLINEKEKDFIRHYITEVTDDIVLQILINSFKSALLTYRNMIKTRLQTAIRYSYFSILSLTTNDRYMILMLCDVPILYLDIQNSGYIDIQFTGHYNITPETLANTLKYDALLSTAQYLKCICLAALFNRTIRPCGASCTSFVPQTLDVRSDEPVFIFGANILFPAFISERYGGVSIGFMERNGPNISSGKALQYLTGKISFNNLIKAAAEVHAVNVLFILKEHMGKSPSFSSVIAQGCQIHAYGPLSGAVSVRVRPFGSWRLKVHAARRDFVLEVPSLPSRFPDFVLDTVSNIAAFGAIERSSMAVSAMKCFVRLERDLASIVFKFNDGQTPTIEVFLACGRSTMADGSRLLLEKPPLRPPVVMCSVWRLGQLRRMVLMTIRSDIDFGSFLMRFRPLARLQDVLFGCYDLDWASSAIRQNKSIFVIVHRRFTLNILLVEASRFQVMVPQVGCDRLLAIPLARAVRIPEGPVQTMKPVFIRQRDIPIVQMMVEDFVCEVEELEAAVAPGGAKFAIVGKGLTVSYELSSRHGMVKVTKEATALRMTAFPTIESFSRGGLRDRLGAIAARRFHAFVAGIISLDNELTVAALKILDEIITKNVLEYEAALRYGHAGVVGKDAVSFAFSRYEIIGEIQIFYTGRIFNIAANWNSSHYEYHNEGDVRQAYNFIWRQIIV